MLVDSNILIYATQPKYSYLRATLIEYLPKISIISKVEILGFHNLKVKDKSDLEELLNYFDLVYLTQPTYEIAIELRQRRNVSLGDALIAATCIEHKLDLMTRISEDYKWIKEIKIIDPFE